MPATHRGTSHSYRIGGPKQHTPTRRYAWPSRVNMPKDGAYLKAWGSRPDSKRVEIARVA